jgi:hypothetical protein
MNRSEPFADDHHRSASVKGDRIRHQPRKLADYLHWLTSAYAMEAPTRLHDRDVADDGAPDQTGETKSWLGMTQGAVRDTVPDWRYHRRGTMLSHERANDGHCLTCEAKDEAKPLPPPTPNDWRAVACRRDADGYLATPMRCAIARIADPERRQLLGGLAVNLLTPLDVTRAQGIPDFCAGDVMWRSLTMLWSVYEEVPIPRRSIGWVDKSDSQRAAEEAA